MGRPAGIRKTCTGGLLELERAIREAARSDPSRADLDDPPGGLPDSVSGWRRRIPVLRDRLRDRGASWRGIRDLALPDLEIGFYDVVVGWDHFEGSCHVVSTGLPDRGDGRRSSGRRKAREGHPVDSAVCSAGACLPGHSPARLGALAAGVPEPGRRAGRRAAATGAAPEYPVDGCQWTSVQLLTNGIPGGGTGGGPEDSGGRHFPGQSVATLHGTRPPNPSRSTGNFADVHRPRSARSSEARAP